LQKPIFTLRGRFFCVNRGTAITFGLRAVEICVPGTRAQQRFGQVGFVGLDLLQAYQVWVAAIDPVHQALVCCRAQAVGVEINDTKHGNS